MLTKGIPGTSTINSVCSSIDTSRCLSTNDAVQATYTTNGKSSQTNGRTSSSTNKVVKRRRSLIARKAPVQLTNESRKFFKSLLSVASTTKTKTEEDVCGILLTLEQSNQTLGLTFQFQFVSKEGLQRRRMVEPVSLCEEGEEVVDANDRQPQSSPVMDAEKNEGLPKLYIDESAFMKVLGGTIKYENDQLVVYNREGFILDPNV